MRCDPTTPATLALGLLLPLAAVGAALAQAKPSWIDPPARAAPGAPGPTTPTLAAPSATPPSATPAANSATAPATPPEGAPQAAEIKSAPSPAEAAAPKPPEASEAGAVAGASMAGPSRRAERPRLRRRAASRMAPETLPAAPRIAREAPSDPRFPGWAGRAEALAGDYLAVFSAPTMVSEAPRFYGERLRFHGQMIGLAALLAEKRRFAQRWPQRRYEPRSSRTACNAALETCIVRTLVTFRTGSPARGAVSQGVAELVLEVRFSGGRPVIVSESSRVLRRGATVGTLAGPGASG